MIERITVLGAGTMGHAIANHFAANGYPVTLFDTYAPALERAPGLIAQELRLFAEEGLYDPADIEPALARITYTDDMAAAVAEADYVIEATPEKLELKQELFAKLDRLCKPEAILASNTSSLALGAMTEKLPPARQAKVMVCHWYNPAHIMPLVELSCFGNMSDGDYQEVADLYRRTGKRPAKVLKDVPGLVANRIQQGVAREVFSLIQQGIAEPEDIDTALKFGPAFRYATTGQLEVADFGGLDIWCAVGDNLLAVMDNSTEANPLLREKVEAGKLGLKSGEGFFTYAEGERAQRQDAFNRRLIRQLKTSREY